jgi:hypothetical protein
MCGPADSRACWRTRLASPAPSCRGTPGFITLSVSRQSTGRKSAACRPGRGAEPEAVARAAGGAGHQPGEPAERARARAPRAARAARALAGALRADAARRARRRRARVAAAWRARGGRCAAPRRRGCRPSRCRGCHVLAASQGACTLFASPLPLAGMYTIGAAARPGSRGCQHATNLRFCVCIRLVLVTSSAAASLLEPPDRPVQHLSLTTCQKCGEGVCYTQCSQPICLC